MNVFILMLLASLLSMFQPAPQLPVPAQGNSAIVLAARNTTHHIALSSISESAGCSATAIAPHALLTASHCEVPSDKINIDGQPHLIKMILRDGNDHSILVVDDTFKFVAEIDQRVPIDQESVFNFGNPGHSVSVYRSGVFEHNDEVDGEDDITRPDYVYALPVYHGDSGSAIFDLSGKVVGVVSLGNDSAEAMAMVMNFTPDQLSAVK